MKRKPQKYVAPVNPGATLDEVIRGSVPAGKLAHSRVEITTGNGQLGGATEFDKKSGGIVRVIVPGGSKAYDLTVQSHESGHAAKSKPIKRKTKESGNAFFARNFVEDCYIEQRPLPYNTPESYKRNHLTAAMADLRSIRNSMRRSPGGVLPDWQARNKAIGIGCRIRAMMRAYGASYKARALFGDTFPGELGQMLSRISALGANKRKRKTAQAMLEALFEPEPENPTIRKPGKPGEPGDDLDEPNNALFRVVDLIPKDSFCVREKAITMRHAPNGVHLNASRFVAAIIQGNGNGLFTRRIRNKPGGTVLIDASGSMRCDQENLSALCKAIPLATVAYYCGNGSQGRLYIYAKDGKRFSGEPERIGSGNDCDLPAIKWLQRQVAPLTLISDLEFCGGKRGDAEIARAIVTRMVAHKQLQVIECFRDAFECFKPGSRKVKVK